MSAPATERPPYWDPELDDTLVCRAVHDETHDVRTFVLSAPQPRRFDYKPGQFLTFEIEIDGQLHQRCYTAASSPTRPHLLSITVKRTASGPVSNWLHDHLRPGTSLRVSGPAGDFTCADHPAGRYLFLSAGSGITPLMSMARAQHDLAAEADILFVHSARSPADLIFRAELEQMSRQRPNFRVVFVCEADAPQEAWSGYRGRLTPAMLGLIAPDLLEREVFLCGPGSYMAGVRHMLDAAGLDPARRHQESFDFAELAIDEPPPAEDAGGFQVAFAKTGREVVCPADTFVLTAARAAGLRLPSSCTKGMCGTCKSRLLSGTVEMNHAGGIRQREIDQGMILLCCSRPTSDLVIER